MPEFLQRDLSSSLLSISVLLGWLGISFVFLRILAITIKKVLEDTLEERAVLHGVLGDQAEELEHQALGFFIKITDFLGIFEKYRGNL